MAMTRRIDSRTDARVRPKRRRTASSVAALLVAAFAVSACSDAPNLVEPTTTEATSATSPSPEVASASCPEADGLTPVASAIGGDAGMRTRMRVIDSKGGRINVATHELIVPEGVVDEATVFVMSAQRERVAVELDAYEWDGGPNPNSNASDFDPDTAEQVEEFNGTMTLRLSYRHAADIDDPNTLQIRELDDSSCDGLGAAVESEVDTRRKIVEGVLEHFSGYIMVAG